MSAEKPIISNYINLIFPIIGDKIPFDHGYLLYSAISRQFPIVHDIEELSILPITGKPEFPQNLYLTPESQLCLRLSTNKVPLIYRLAGKTLNLNTDKIRLGLPESHELEGCDRLYARLVIIRGFDEPNAFIKAVERQLESLNISAKINLTTKLGKPIRRTMKIKGRTLIGFGVEISELSEDNSILLQEQGIGGKHKMGCGVFVPI
jgi:CRISPR-associated protein Cas6